MKQYKSNDMFKDLKVLVDKYVTAYKSDFEIDKEIINECLNDKERDLIWFLRDTGTCCMREKLAYMKGTFSNAECTTWLKDSKAYYLQVNEKNDDKIIGNIIPIDEEKLFNEIVETSETPDYVLITPKEQDAFEVAYEKYNAYPNKYVGVFEGECEIEYKFNQEKEQKIQQILRKHRNERERANEHDICELVSITKDVLDKAKNAFEPNAILFELQSDNGNSIVQFTINTYANNDNLAVGLFTYDEELDIVDWYGSITINTIDMPYLYAAIDTNDNGNRIMNFLIDNELGYDTGRCVSSGYCQYPIFKFSEKRLQEVCPEGFAEYQKAIGMQPNIVSNERKTMLNNAIQQAQKETSIMVEQMTSDDKDITNDLV